MCGFEDLDRNQLIQFYAEATAGLSVRRRVAQVTVYKD